MDRAFSWREFGRGFGAMVPLWIGAVPAGVAYGVAARAAGFGAGEAQLMSLVVFSAAAQLGAVASWADGEPAALLVGTAMALNLQLVLIGAAVAPTVGPSWRRQAATAWFLTEGAYGVASADGLPRPARLLGAGVSMYVAWNAGTAIGAFGGGRLPDGGALGLDLVAPLTFLAVLVPLLRTRAAVMAGLVAAVAALALERVVPLGVAVLAAGLAGSAAGTWSARGAGDRSGEPTAGGEGG